MMSTILMMVLIIVVFYFFMIRPQSQKQKKLEEERNALGKGDKVVTAGGIHGTVKKIEDTTMMIEIAKDIVIRVDKASIYAVPAVKPEGKQDSDKPEKKGKPDNGYDKGGDDLAYDKSEDEGETENIAGRKTEKA